MKRESFTIHTGETCVLTACLELVAFSDAPAEAGAPGFAGFYAAFREQFGDSLKWYNTANMSRMRKVDAAAREMVPFWFSGEPGTPPGNLSLYAHGGKTPQDSVPPAFEMFCDRNSDGPNAFFRMVLPVDWLADDAGPFLRLAQTALKRFPLLSGYAGYSLY